MNLPPGVRSETVKTDRLRMRYIDSGPQDGVPVVMIHGNLSTGRFFEHLMPGAPAAYRLIAPDMRGFGDTESKPIDATRGLRILLHVAPRGASVLQTNFSEYQRRPRFQVT